MHTDNELFSTATVAQIYLDQGKLEQAERIYRRLLEDAPDDSSLIAALAECKRRRLTSSLGDEDKLTVDPLARGVLKVQWNISKRGLQRAQLASGDEGALTLRLVGFPVQGEERLDTPLPQATGELELPLPQGATLAAASVGLLDGDKGFTSIVHSKIVQLGG